MAIPGWIWSDLGEMALASLLGGAIGIERRLKARTAGLRTPTLIAAGSCLVMEASRYVSRLEPGGDPGQIAQSILVGIGFLGGGAILRAGVTIQGLTTAATIWCSAAVGMAAGAGMPIHALALCAITLLGLLALEPLESLLPRRRDLRRIVVDATSGPELVDRLRAVLPAQGVLPQTIGVKQEVEAGRIRVTITADCPEDMPPVSLLSELERLPGVTDVELE
jgi:putative Mg2+ transporter-C (MgtC) family protein